MLSPRLLGRLADKVTQHVEGRQVAVCFLFSRLVNALTHALHLRDNIALPLDFPKQGADIWISRAACLDIEVFLVG